MKNLILLFVVWSWLPNAYGEEVLISYPDRRFYVTNSKVVEEKLTEEQSKKNAIIITKEGNEFIWKSRGGNKLEHIESGLFHVFNSKLGSGYVKLSENAVMEHVHLGLTTYTYYGRIHTIKPDSISK